MRRLHFITPPRADVYGPAIGGCCARVAGHDRTSAHLEVEGVGTEPDRTEITWCK